MRFYIYTMALSLWFGTAAPCFAADIAQLQNTIRTLTKNDESRALHTEGHERAKNFIEAEFKKYDLIPLGATGSASYRQDFKAWKQEGTNLIGGLGDFSGDQKCVVVGAHYDGLRNHSGRKSIPAADDNASGIAGMLEIARNLSNKKDTIDGCVIFAAWDYEEAGEYTNVQGLFTYRTLGTNGSAYFVEHPTVALDKIQLSITFDLIGGDFFKGAENLYMILGVESSVSLRPMIQRAKSSDKAEATGLNFDIRALEPLHNVIQHRDDYAAHRSDYDGFRDSNIPFLFLSTGTPWYYHTRFDRETNINYTKLKSISEFTQRLIEQIITKDTTVPSVAQNQPQQDWRETAVNMQFVMKQLLDHAQENLLNESFAYGGKVYDGNQVKIKLERQIAKLNRSIERKHYFALNTPWPRYASMLLNILAVTRLRLVQEYQNDNSGSQKSE